MYRLFIVIYFVKHPIISSPGTPLIIKSLKFPCSSMARISLNLTQSIQNSITNVFIKFIQVLLG